MKSAVITIIFHFVFARFTLVFGTKEGNETDDESVFELPKYSCEEPILESMKELEGTGAKAGRKSIFSHSQTGFFHLEQRSVHINTSSNKNNVAINSRMQLFTFLGLSSGRVRIAFLPQFLRQFDDRL